MDLGIAGRTAAVAAASGGLGFGSAQALVAEGVRVAICGRHAEAVGDAVTRLGGSEHAVGIVTDVGTPEGATAFVTDAIAALGTIDILVTNAGGPPAGTFASTDLDLYEPALALNLLSTVAMCKAAVPPMQQRGWGRVVAITSSTVRQPNPVLILSNTARAGATAFLKTLATEVARDGVTVNSVQPGSHDTARLRSLHGDDLSRAAASVPTGTVGDAGDFGAIVTFLCSEQAKFLTGVAIQVDGGAYAGLQ